MKQVHRVDDQRDIRGILPDRVGKILLGDDGIGSQQLGSPLEPRAREVAINAPGTRLADGRDLLEYRRCRPR